MSFQTADVSNEYKKNEKLKKSDVVHLQEWVKKQPHLPQISELQLIIFLHSCYFSIEAAKNTINSFFITKARCPELFSNRDPLLPILQQQMEITCDCILPKLTTEGYAVMYCAFVDPDSSNFVYSENFKLFDMILHLRLAEEGSMNGLVIILDSKISNFGYTSKFGITTFRKALHYVQEALPVRRKTVHVVNVNPWAHKLFSLIKPFLNKEELERIHIHSNSLESLYEFIPKECLPKELGGFGDSVATLQEMTNKRLMDNREFFIQEALQISDESKRTSECKSRDDIGYEGSFRKLDID